MCGRACLFGHRDNYLHQFIAHRHDESFFQYRSREFGKTLRMGGQRAGSGSDPPPAEC